MPGGQQCPEQSLFVPTRSPLAWQELGAQGLEWGVDPEVGRDGMARGWDGPGLGMRGECPRGWSNAQLLEVPQSGTSRSHLCYLIQRGQGSSTVGGSRDPSLAMPQLQTVHGWRSSRGSCRHSQPLGTAPSCRGSSWFMVTPALPFPWDAAGSSACTASRKQERGLGAPASLQAGQAGLCAGLCGGNPAPELRRLRHGFGSGTEPLPGEAASCHGTVCELAWPCVHAQGHRELPKEQKGLEQRPHPSLSAPRAGSQLHSLLAWLVYGSPAGVPWSALCRVGRQCSARCPLQRPPAPSVCLHPTSCRNRLGSLALGCVRLPRPVGFGRAPCNATFFPRAFRKQTCSFFPFLPTVFGPCWGWLGGRGSRARLLGTAPAPSQVAGRGRGQPLCPGQLARTPCSTLLSAALVGRSELWVTVLFQQPSASWGLWAPSLPPQPWLAERAHPGTAGASGGSPLGKQEGLKFCS